MTNDEELVHSLLTHLGCRADRYTKEHRTTKTPDFRVTFHRDDFVFHCEVKGIGNKETEGLLHTRIFNLFTSKIHDAVKQFQSVNPDRTAPNVLVFVSEEMRINWHSFLEFLQGEISITKDGKREVLVPLRKISQHRVRDEIATIDLYIVLQGHTPTFFFNPRNEAFTQKLKEIFRTGTRELPTTPVA